MQTKRTAPRRVRVERGIYRSPATGRYEIQYTDETGRCRWQVVGHDLEDARVARAEAQLGFARNGRSPRARRTFREVAEEWLRAQTHLRPRTYRLYETAVDRHLLPRLGDRRIATIDEVVVAELIADLREHGLAGWTIRGILVPLGRICSYARRRKLIAYNPVRRLDRSERPRVVRREMRILNSDEIDALLQTAPSAYRPILATAVFTGLRQGELLGLRWGDIDFESGVVHVRRQRDRSGTYTEPKTPRAIRAVVLMPSLAALLQEHKRARQQPGESDPVFASASGRPMHYRNVTRRGLTVAIAAAGIDRDGKPHLRFHDLRHTFASLLIAQGLNVVFVSRQLGHASPSFTLDIYGGLFDGVEHARRASEGLEASFADVLRSRRRLKRKPEVDRGVSSDTSERWIETSDGLAG